MKTIYQKLRRRLPVVVLISASAVGGTTLAFTNKTAEKAKSVPVAVNLPLDETSIPRDALPSGSFASIVKKVAPAVVKIDVTATVKNTDMQQWPGLDDPFWRHFFGNQFGRTFP